MSTPARIVVSALAVLLYAAPARAADAPGEKIDKRVCIAAAERGQELREGKQMRDARAQFALCARSECPESVAKECVRWGAEAEAALGSVKLEAVDAAGRPVTRVKVVIDGAPWSDEVPAEPVLLDPGSHEIRFEHTGDAPVVRSLSLAMGDRGRVIRATFAPANEPAKPAPAIAAPPPKPASSGDGLVLPLVLGGVGVVALGAATTFWLLGNSELDDTRDRCQRGCPESETDGARTKHLVGDIALGAGIVALGAAAYFFFTREKPRTAGTPFVVRF